MDDDTRKDSLEWRPGRSIPLAEFTFTSDTSGGPGGQHANRSATRITLSWDLPESPSFSDSEKKRLLRAFERRMSTEGIVQIRSSSERSARRNRDECLRILASEIRNALRPRKKRIATKPSAGSKKRRVNEKKRRAKVKKGRQRPRIDE